MRKTFRIHGYDVDIWLDSDRVLQSAGLAERLERVGAALALLPRQHIEWVREPIIVVDRLPSWADTGGGWFAPGTGPETAGRFTSRSGWGTPLSNAELGTRTRGNTTGVIGITSTAFLKDEHWGGGHLAHEYTALHEFGHAVNYHSGTRHNGLIPARGLRRPDGNGPYQGQRYSPPRLGELAAEAYSRFFLNETDMCRNRRGTPPCNRHGALRCSARLQRDLQSTPAFAGIGWNFPLASAEVPDRLPSERYASTQGSRRGPTRGNLEIVSGPSPRASWRRPGPYRA